MGTEFLTLRVRKQDSAFVYAILEAEEGIAAYSTLDCPVAAAYRDLELMVPADFKDDVLRVIEQLGDSTVVLGWSTITSRRHGA